MQGKKLSTPLNNFLRQSIKNFPATKGEQQAIAEVEVAIAVFLNGRWASFENELKYYKQTQGLTYSSID